MPRSSPKIKLSQEKIADVALDLIEKKGLDSFSMRALAAKLQIQPMSIYHHFPSRLDLLNAVLDRVLTEFTFLGPERDWETRLRHVALEWRKLALKYPRFYPFLSVHRMIGPSSEGLFSFARARRLTR